MVRHIDNVLVSLMFLGTFVLTGTGNAADIQWNMFEYRTLYGNHDSHSENPQDGHPAYFDTWYYDKTGGGNAIPTTGCPEIAFECSVNNSGDLLMHVVPYGNLANWTLWQAFDAGDIVCETTTWNADSVLYNAIVDPPCSDYDIELRYGETAYMGFANGMQSENSIYGWVAIEWTDGILATIGSAFDADGGPMIVGGGSALTPEPSGVLMLLLGGGALALRRKK